MKPTDRAIKRVVERSQRLVAEERLDENAELLAGSVRQFPDNAEVHLHASAGAFAAGAPEDAKRLTRRAAELAWEDPHRLTWAASQILNLGETEEAKRWIRRVYEIAPDDFEFAAELAHLVGKLALLHGNDEQAEQMLRMAFDLEPSGVGYARLLADLLARRGRIDEALDVLAKALRHHPGDGELKRARERLLPDSGGAATYTALQEALRGLREGRATLSEVRQALQAAEVFLAHSGTQGDNDITLPVVPRHDRQAVAIYSSLEVMINVEGTGTAYLQVPFATLMSGFPQDVDAVLDPGTNWELHLPGGTLDTPH